MEILDDMGWVNYQQKFVFLKWITPLILQSDIIDINTIICDGELVR